jgi:hypothetical protein
MDTGITEIGSYSRRSMILDIDTLLALKPSEENAGKPVDFLQKRLVS